MDDVRKAFEECDNESRNAFPDEDGIDYASFIAGYYAGSAAKEAEQQQTLAKLRNQVLDEAAKACETLANKRSEMDDYEEPCYGYAEGCVDYARECADAIRRMNDD